MKILFDAYWWAEGPFSNRTVQREFIQTWAEAFPADELLLMVPQAHIAAARKDTPATARLVGTRLRPHAAAAALAAPWVARQVRADCTITHNFAPIAGRSAVFIHDVLFQTNPEWFTRSERCYFRLMPLLAPRAELVVASSRTEAARIRAQNPRLRLVLPVGLAVRTALCRAEPMRPAGVPDEFVLTVGRLNVRKNLVTTLCAALRSGAIGAQRPIVVVGEADGRGAELPAEVRRGLEMGAIILVSSVSDAGLSWLYRNAQVFVFLSLDEGFGLTPVEAVTFGCPCIVSDIAVFRETLGDRATYVAPDDVNAAARAISAALAAPRVSPDLLELSWLACVARIRAAVAEAS